MKSAISKLLKVGRRVKIAAMSLFLCCGMLLTSFFPAPRTFAEEEIETPVSVLMASTQACATRSPLVRLPSPPVIHPQVRAIDRGVQTRHGNNEQSKRNGTGSYLLI